MASPSNVGAQFYQNNDAYTGNVGARDTVHNVLYDDGDKGRAYISRVHTPARIHHYEGGPDLSHTGFSDRPLQGRLFGVEHEKNVIDGAYATPEAKHHVGTMLGIIAHKSLRETGKLPEASDDLSQSSAAMVQHLVNKGIIKNPSAEHTGDQVVKSTNRLAAGNAVQTTKWAIEDQMIHSSAVPEHEVRQGRTLARHLLRANRKMQDVKSAVRSGAEQLEMFKKPDK